LVNHTWVLQRSFGNGIDTALVVVVVVVVIDAVGGLGNPFVGNDDAAVADAARQYEILRLDIDAVFFEAHARILCGMWWRWLLIGAIVADIDGCKKPSACTWKSNQFHCSMPCHLIGVCA
jgi:hypothetical protein